MVFENLTLFEIQLDGSQFGPRSMNRDEIETDDAMDDDGGRGRLLPVVLLAIVAIGGGMLYRRSRSSDLEFDAEAEDAEADLTTSQ